MKKVLGLFFLILIIGVPTYVYTSSTFERDVPNITTEHSDFWNLRDKFKIKIDDESGIKFYKVVIINDGKAKILLKKEFLPSEIRKSVEIDLKLPEFYNVKGDKILLKVEAVDNSKWNYFAGNQVDKEFSVNIDTTSPNTEVINNNYGMKRGGSGIAIVKVEDNNLEDAYIKISERDKPTNFKIFKLTPFYKKGYYISFLAWPYNYKTFSADLVAKDKAGNISHSHIPIRWKKVRYSKAKIKINNYFIKNVAVPLLHKMGIDVPQDYPAIFKKINEDVRKISEDKLYKITDVIFDKKIDNLYIKRFRPMKGAAKKADYGEMRTYSFDGNLISSAVHKGLDLASFAHAKIYASNRGKVIYEGFNGIYGNTLAIYHKLGLVSTYSHCSSFNVGVGSLVSNGQVIARTGATGAVFGDHLHFGIYIQGIPVQPLEWLDSHWIKDNITSVLIKAKRMINR
jgi:hypothetical protein